MSAPKTDVEKQQRRHMSPILGIAAAVVVALLALVWWVTTDEDLENQAAPTVTEETVPTGSATAPANAESAPADTATAPATEETAPAETGATQSGAPEATEQDTAPATDN